MPSAPKKKGMDSPSCRGTCSNEDQKIKNKMQDAKSRLRKCPRTDQSTAFFILCLQFGEQRVTVAPIDSHFTTSLCATWYLLELDILITY